MTGWSLSFALYLPFACSLPLFSLPPLSLFLSVCVFQHQLKLWLCSHRSHADTQSQLSGLKWLNAYSMSKSLIYSSCSNNYKIIAPHEWKKKKSSFISSLTRIHSFIPLGFKKVIYVVNDGIFIFVIKNKNTFFSILSFAKKYIVIFQLVIEIENSANFRIICDWCHARPQSIAFYSFNGFNANFNN